MMKRPLRIAAVLFAALVALLLSKALYAGSITEHSGSAFGTASIYVGASVAPLISITRSALRELRELMARCDYRTGICITGPFEEDPRAPDSIEEAWLLEKLYGPPQRWVLDIVPLRDLSAPSLDPGERFFVQEVSGIQVGVLTSKTVSRLSVEFYRDAIRVYELDA
ncbi:MAG TPA: hypothetical protein VEH51_04670 [Burkholderiales bacterium]|nr:hypothetical protein [Burkholderiales bacterium]